jgi:hypothetical protein
LGEKDVATDEGANAVQAEFNPKPTKLSENDAVIDATAKEAYERTA